MHADKDSEIGAISAIGPFAAPPHTKYERLLARAKEVPAARTIVVHPCDETSLRGPLEAGRYYHAGPGRASGEDPNGGS